MAKTFKEYITESFSKIFAFRKSFWYSSWILIKWLNNAMDFKGLLPIATSAARTIPLKDDFNKLKIDLQDNYIFQIKKSNLSKFTSLGPDVDVLYLDSPKKESYFPWDLTNLIYSSRKTIDLKLLAVSYTHLTLPTICSV